MSNHVWMEHAVTGGRAQLPDLPYWRLRGWEPCDGPPPEPDLTIEPTAQTPPSAGPAAVQESAAPAKPERKSEKGVTRG